MNINLSIVQKIYNPATVNINIQYIMRETITNCFEHVYHCNLLRITKDIIAYTNKKYENIYREMYKII